jgi:sec-independent protein translocase protein TatA
MHFPTAFISMPGGVEWVMILGIGLLLFGKRLPEVGRSLGRGIVEFKKGLKGIEDEVEDASSHPTPPRSLPAEFKFDPQTGQPINKLESKTDHPTV